MRLVKPFGPDGAFLPDLRLREDLRGRAMRGAGLTLFSGGMGIVTQIVATIALARLLAPSDYGVVTMATTFTLLLSNFGLNGFTEAIVQREKIDHALVTNLFWINAAGGLVLFLASSASGLLLSKFYGDPRLTPVVIWVSTTILITSLSVQHLALLKRAMLFSVISYNDIGARVAAILISIALGWAGLGYWALVGGVIAAPLFTTIGAWGACRWLPGLPKRVNGTGSMVVFSLNTYGRFCINYFARNLDNVLVGWRFSATSLGFYKRAYDLFALSAGSVVAPLTVVVVAALSRLNRDSEEYRRYLLASLTMVAFAGMGLGAILTLVGTDVIRLLLGPGWEPAGRLFTFFGPGVGIMMLYYTHGWIHLSIGRPDRWFRWGAVEFAVTVSLFVAGLGYGPAGVAVAWTASFWILTIPAIWYALKPTRIGIAPVIEVVWKYCIASLAAGCATWALLKAFPALVHASGWLGSCERMVSTVASFLVLYIAAVLALHGGTEPIKKLAEVGGALLPKWMSSNRVPPAPEVSPNGSAGDYLSKVSPELEPADQRP